MSEHTLVTRLRAIKQSKTLIFLWKINSAVLRFIRKKFLTHIRSLLRLLMLRLRKHFCGPHCSLSRHRSHPTVFCSRLLLAKTAESVHCRQCHLGLPIVVFAHANLAARTNARLSTKHCPMEHRFFARFRYIAIPIMQPRHCDLSASSSVRVQSGRM